VHKRSSPLSLPDGHPHRLASPVDGCAEVSGAVGRLRQAIELAGRRARALDRPVLAWAAARISRVEPVALFAQLDRTTGPCMLWDAPADGFGLVGAGAAWTVTTDGPERFDRAGSAWQSLLKDAVGDDGADAWAAGPIATGGFAFAAGGPTGAVWDGYPAGTLVLPRLSIATAGDGSWLTLSIVIAPRSPAFAAVEKELTPYLNACAAARLGMAQSGMPARVSPRLVEELPPADAWKETVRAAAAATREGRLKKIVLARAIRMRAAAFDSVRTLRKLRASYPGCTLFAITRDDRCFLGATPERLVRLRGREVAVAAVAGSAPRGGSEDEDARLGRLLLSGAKDRLEHALVVDAMRDVLDEVSTGTPSTGEVSLLKLGNIQHLYTPLTAVLREPHTVLELAAFLHPTPAVGGVPRAAALRWISKHERLDRGWYAGPVGWMDRRGNGEFAVAIRSALIKGTEALLFAGCGIVGDSDPDQEYAESWLKLRSILPALQGS
jgi:isochorismate synthase